MKKLIFALIAVVYVTVAYSQTQADRKYSPQQLKADGEFLKKQLFDAHANPFTELSRQQYEQLFAAIESKITDSLNTTAFYKLIKPVFSYLSDEHSGITIDSTLMSTTYWKQPVFLPFNLTKTSSGYLVNDMFKSVPGLTKGDKILKINNIPVKDLIERCSHYTTGFPDQRQENALKQFGYLYTWSDAEPRHQYKILTDKGREVIAAGVSIKAWLDYLNITSGNDCPQLITYTRYGDAGYINSCSFMTHNNKEFDALSAKIDSIFKQVKNDGIKRLFIDVSHNSGGNSAVGNVLIDHFYNKPYTTYQCNWRRSDEYLSLITKWGLKDDNYTSKTPGSIIHFGPDTIGPPENNPDRFNGKVYIIVGEGTFSSAMMFATIIRDNHIALLVGQTPQNGHPNHFGEQYNAKLPNTQLPFRFGVKEWIRPAGKNADNYLVPDELIDPGKYSGVKQIIDAVTK